MSALDWGPPVRSRSAAAALGLATCEIVLRPGRFFRTLLRFQRGSTPLLLIWILGVTAALDNLQARILVMNALGRPVPPQLTNWTSVWPIALLAGILAGGVAWLVQGWWFRMRLRLSGAPPETVPPDAARLVWLYAGLVWAIPSLVVTILATPLHPDLQASMSAGFLGLTELVMACWSCFVGYRGAVSCFPVRRPAARLWFLVLPLGFFLALIAGVIVASIRPFLQ